MLAATARLRFAREFDSVVRGGRRSGRSSLVVHLRPAPDRTVTRAGFVVSRAVGGSVVRNRVKRRLRELVRRRTAGIVGYDLVVRALPAAAGTTFAGLRRDLDAALMRLGFPDQSPDSGRVEPGHV